MKIECPKLTQWEHWQFSGGRISLWKLSRSENRCMLILLRKFSCELLGLWQALTHSHQKNAWLFRLQQPAFFGWLFSGKNRFFDFAKGKDLEPTLVLKRSSENSRELCFVHGNATDNNSYSHGWSCCFLGAFGGKAISLNMFHQYLFFMVFRGAANHDPPEVCRSWKIPGSGTMLVG